MTFDEFIAKYLGTKVDWDNAYAGQCVDLFRQYIHDVLGKKQPNGVVGAADFWTKYDADPNLYKTFDKISNTPTGVPKKGDCVIWNKNAGGGFGHVAIFIEGNSSSFTSLDQNWPTLSKVTKTKHDYKNVLGWFTPKVIISPTPPMTLPTELQTYTIGWKDLALKHGLDVNAQEFTTYRAIDAQIATRLSQAVDPLNKKIANLELEVTTTQNKAKADLEKALIDCERKMSDQKASLLKDQEKLIEEHKLEVEELKKLIQYPPQPAKPRTGVHARWVEILDALFGYTGR